MDFGFYIFFFVNSVCCLGLVFLSEKNGDVDYKIVLCLKEKKNFMLKKLVWCVFKSRDGFKKKYFEGDFFIVWCYFYIYVVKL